MNLIHFRWYLKIKVILCPYCTSKEQTFRVNLCIFRLLYDEIFKSGSENFSNCKRSTRAGEYDVLVQTPDSSISDGGAFTWQFKNAQKKLKPI